ncbi:MAG: biopolymer transporter ExbD [Cryobacterium sp.]|nr:biopolymer transporter ExbD [Oligoflexia bacterium]
MPAFRSIRTRRRKRKLNAAFELQLTSLIDVLVIILVFLLKSYQTSMNNLTTVSGLQMPISSSQDEPRDSLQVILTPEGITFEGVRVLDFQQDVASAGASEGTYKLPPEALDEGGKRVVALFNTLVAAREKSELLKQKSPVRDAQGNPLPFDGVLAVTADKRIQYDTLRKIMYTAGAAGFKIFRFTALKKET